MRRILMQFDTDSHASSFDRVVAIDAGVDELFSYANITPETVTPLVHGGMFTRKPSDLRSTAIFIGGSSVSAGEAVFKKVLKTFFGPVRLSVMMDSNGSNTTAAAAVVCIERHWALKDAVVAVLGGTGPVGWRAAQILADQGAQVRLVSRSLDKAEAACRELAQRVEGSRLQPGSSASEKELLAACQGCNVVVSAGAAGAQLMSARQWQNLERLQVAIDLNAVPPAGLEGIEVHEKNVVRNGVACYGAIGVGGTKMKIHRAAIETLFTANDQILDTAAIYQIGRSIG